MCFGADPIYAEVDVDSIDPEVIELRDEANHEIGLAEEAVLRDVPVDGMARVEVKDADALPSNLTAAYESAQKLIENRGGGRDTSTASAILASVIDAKRFIAQQHQVGITMGVIVGLSVLEYTRVVAETMALNLNTIIDDPTLIATAEAEYVRRWPEETVNVQSTNSPLN